MVDPIKAIVAILGLLLVLVFGAWLLLGRSGPSSGSTQETDSEAIATPGRASQPAIPTLDSAVPTKTETATFALG